MSESGALGTALDSQQFRHALNEAAWAARLLLHLEASVIFLAHPQPDCLTAVAWHGREAGGAAIDLGSPAVSALRAGRRSIAWDRRERCPDPQVLAVLDGLDLAGGLVVPLSANKEFLGLWLAATVRDRVFGDRDELIMTTLAENIGLTTESTLLSAETLRYRREADALYEISKEILRLMDLDQVLHLICQKTCALLHAEISYLALADDAAGVVRVHVTEGARNDHLRTMVLKYGEGVGGYVASTRRPLLIDNYPADPRPKPPGIAYIAATEDITSIISVPMVTRSGLIGVLFAASRHEAVFNRSQVDLLSALGAQAAIAIENARLYEQQKVAAEKLRAGVITHEQLLNLVLDNQGLQAIADTLSQLVGCPVVVQDARLRVLCRSVRGWHATEAKMPGGETPAALVAALAAEAPAARGDAAGVRHTIHIPAAPGQRVPYARTVAPIKAGASLFGYVTVVETCSPLSDQAGTTLEQASIVFALEFLKEEAARLAEQRLANDLIDDLLFGQAEADSMLYQRAARLQMDLRAAQRVIVVDIDNFAEAIRRHGWNDMDTLAVKRRFLAAVSETVRRDFPGSLTGRRSDSVLVIVPEMPGQGLPAARALAAAVQAALAAALPDLTASIGIGRAAAGAGQLPHSYDDAIMALRSAALVRQTNCVVAAEDLGVLPLLLQSQEQQRLLDFARRYLDPLLEYDTAHGGQLVETLRAFLVQCGNLRHTSEACHIHLNTLKYRMGRIRELTGLDLDDGNTRFNLQLALSIHAAFVTLRGK